jgi:RHS repeat-associated protein
MLVLDNRTGTVENGTQTWTLYDGSDPIMDFNSSGSLETRYLNGPTGQLVDSVLARESSGGTVAWYLPDRLGTIRDLISSSGSIIDHIDFSAFSTVLDQSDPSEGDRMMGFAGMELDSATGMNLAVYRVQDPGTGRWTSQDPLGFGGGQTDLYVDVANAPTIQSDPAGLMSFIGPPPNFGPPPTQTFYDFRQYEKLYNDGEISWWEWTSIGLFPPSDVPVYQVPAPNPGWEVRMHFPANSGPRVATYRRLKGPLFCSSTPFAGGGGGGTPKKGPKPTPNSKRRRIHPNCLPQIFRLGGASDKCPRRNSIPTAIGSSKSR